MQIFHSVGAGRVADATYQFVVEQEGHCVAGELSSTNGLLIFPAYAEDDMEWPSSVLPRVTTLFPQGLVS
jgi:hypothetical protein